MVRMLRGTHLTESGGVVCDTVPRLCVDGLGGHDVRGAHGVNESDMFTIEALRRWRKSSDSH